MSAHETGIGISGSSNIVRNNVVVEAEGACIRLGGAEVDGVQYGINNEVRCRDLTSDAVVQNA